MTQFAIRLVEEIEPVFYINQVEWQSETNLTGHYCSVHSSFWRSVSSGMNRRFFMRGLNHRVYVQLVVLFRGRGDGTLAKPQGVRKTTKKKIVCYAGNTYATRCSAQTNIYDRLFSNNSDYVSYIKQQEQLKKLVTADKIAH